MIASSLSGLWGTALLGVGNHLWQSTMFASLIAALTFTLRQNHAKARYWLWFIASIKLLVPFSLLMILGSHLTWMSHPFPHRNAGTSPGSYLLVEDIGQPFTHVTGMWVADEPPTNLASHSLGSGIANFLGPIPLVPAVFITVWLCGLMLVVGWWTSRWLRIRAAIKKALPVLGGREAEALRRTERLVGLQRKIELRLLPFSLEPGIFGVARPVLLWPKAISARLDDAHLEAVLAHEVCHVRRGDNLTAAIHMLVEAIFWFHPLVWWLQARLVEERERACDEEVLEFYTPPEKYAESILRVCEFCVESPLACVSGITGADLKKRIRSIMAPRTVKLDISQKIMITFFAFAAIAAPLALGLVRMIPLYGQVLHPA